jgi:uncharacterized protein YprB with RNaseH-like and TPR domain
MDISTLKDRLRAIVKSPAPVLENTDGVEGAGQSLDNVLAGAWRENPAGRSFVITRRFAAADLHGSHRVEEFGQTLRDASTSASLVGRASAEMPFVFFDLETTGLNGGAGTHAFLIGCGWFDSDNSFITEQHLMTEFSAERSMLCAVGDDLRKAGTLMSFNGKSFDAPMLETRYLFHRLSSPCANRPHVDLLHPARRFWSNTSEAGCSLGALEQQVLAVVRKGDVEGFEIPARYFQFVRTGDARPLVDVLHHNRIDLLSLAGLTARIFDLVQKGPGSAAYPREALALGRVYREAGLEERAEGAFERALTLLESLRSSQDAAQNRPSTRRVDHLAVKIEAIRSLAVGARRQRRYAAAAARWRQLLELADCPHPVVREATEALAIHHEHRARDLVAAKLFASRGVELEAAPARGDAARHRLARIERKLISERTLFPSSTLLRLPLSSDSPTSGRQTSS